MFYVGQNVKFVSLANCKFTFYGRVLRSLGPFHYLVLDHTGLKPRVISANRLESSHVPFGNLGGEVA